MVDSDGRLWRASAAVADDRAMPQWRLRDRPATQGKGEGSSHEYRPLVLRSTLSLVSVDPEGRDDCPTRNAGALASGRLSPLLALEIASTGRATADRDRIARADPADEHGEFSLGCAAHPWRTAQARV